MPKKRGRPPARTMRRGRGRGRGRGRRHRPNPNVERSRVQARAYWCPEEAEAASAASATVSEPVATGPTSPYTPGKPFVVPVAYDEGPTPVWKPKTVKPHEAKFQLPPPRPDNNDLTAVIMALTRVYLPDGYIMKCYKHTLQYIAKRKLHPRQCYKIVPRDILHLFCMIYYMGYCKLPSKEDYWCEGDDIRGDHPVCTAFGMTFKKFHFLCTGVTELR